MRVFLLFLISVFIPLIYSRFCSHTTKGICEVSELNGWCFHDKSTGRFDCDDTQFCKNQTSLKGKSQIAGCFDLNGNYLCCCNKGHLCNTLLVDYSPQTNLSQECTFTTDLPEEEHTLIYRNCSEEWCFSFISADKSGGATTVQKGCESRSLLKHLQNKVADEEFKNNTEWQYSEPFFNAPRCNEIVAAAGLLGTGNSLTREDIRVCLDLEFTQDDVPSKGKLCCCQGQSNCNSDILWSDVAISMKEIEKYRGKTDSTLNSAINLNFSFCSSLFLFFSLMAFVKLG